MTREEADNLLTETANKIEELEELYAELIDKIELMDFDDEYDELIEP